MGRAFAVKTVHKGMYPATYNFKDEADGAEGTDIDFVDFATDGTEVTIIAVNDGHRKVLQNADVGGSNTIQNIFAAAHTSGIVEFWFKSADVTNRTNIQLYDNSATAIIIYLRMDASELKYYIGAVLTATGLTMVNDTWYHIKLQLYADNTFDYWINGIQYADGVACNNNMTDGIDRINLTAYIHTDYFDAIGYSWDTDYNIGDNVHWRHFKESTDSLELDDVGTQGTSITWVDTVDTAASVEIVQEFNEHKKILRQDYTSAVGGYDYCEHNFASQAKNGWFSFYIKVTDVTGDSKVLLYEGVTLITSFRIAAMQFQKYTGSAYSQIAGSPTSVNDTIYHIVLKWADAATDTIECWINNILYETYNAQSNQTSGVDSVHIQAYASGNYVYIDAPMSSLDSDVRADNRTFDYNNTYTKTDITTDVKNVNYENKIYSWRTATLYAKSSYEFTNVFFEIYDVNSKLAMRGEIKNRVLEKGIYRYPLRDMNWDDLNEPITTVFTTDKIHDPTDSTSMLKTALPNISQVDGDLILSTADTEATTYSPTLRFYPTHMFLRDISDLGDTVTIVKASGIVLLDDDLVSGDSLDVDVAADKRKMSGEPIPTDILESINYFEILGAINTETGQRFYKLIDNSGTDKKRKWRYVNNGFKIQADVDAYAAILSARITTVKIIRFSVQSLGVHDMGTTLNYKYIKGLISIAQANYYIISETINFDANLATIVLSEGLIEESKYSAAFERPENYVNSFASEIYETDIITLTPAIWQGNAPTDREYYGRIELDAVDDMVATNFLISQYVDESRNVIIKWILRRIDANNDTVDIIKHVFTYNTVADSDGHPWDTIGDTFPAKAAGREWVETWTLTSDDYSAGDFIDAWLFLNEVREVDVLGVVVEYYIKRLL